MHALKFWRGFGSVISGAKHHKSPGCLSPWREWVASIARSCFLSPFETLGYEIVQSCVFEMREAAYLSVQCN